MSADYSFEGREIPIIRELSGIGKTELTSLEVSCGCDPEEPPIIHRFQVDENSSFGGIVEDTGLNILEIQRVERWGLPEDEIDYAIMPLDQVCSLQGNYAPIDQNGKRHPDRLVSVCLDD